MSEPNEIYATSLVYDFLLKKDTTLASIFQKKFSAKALVKGSPTLEDVLSQYHETVSQKVFESLLKQCETGPTSVFSSSSSLSSEESYSSSDSNEPVSSNVKPLLKGSLSAKPASSIVKPPPKGSLSTKPAPSVLKPLPKGPLSAKPLPKGSVCAKPAPSIPKPLPKGSPSQKTSQKKPELIEPRAVVARRISSSEDSSDLDDVPLAKRMGSVSKPPTNVARFQKFQKKVSTSSLSEESYSTDDDSVIQTSSIPKLVTNLITADAMLSHQKTLLKKFDSKLVPKKATSSDSEDSSSESDDDDPTPTKRAKSVSKPATNALRVSKTSGKKLELKPITVRLKVPKRTPLDSSSASESDEDTTAKTKKNVP